MNISTLSRSSTPGGEPAPQEGARQSSSPFHIAGRVLLMLTLFGAPWAFGAVEPWAWGTMMVLVFLTLILWALGYAQRGVLRVSLSPLYWPFLAFLALACLQLIAGLSGNHVATREATLKLLTNLLIFFLVGQLFFTHPRSGKGVKRLGLMVSILAFALSVLALAQLMTTGHGKIYWSVVTHYGPFGPYVSPNDYCGLMEMLIPIAAGYILSGTLKRIPPIFLWLVVGVALASVGISGSRAGAAVMLIELLLFAFIVYRYGPDDTWRRTLPLIVGIILVSAGVFAWIVNPGRLGTRGLTIFQTDNSVQVKLADRLWVARDTLRILRDHPLLGMGVGTFQTTFPAYMRYPSDMEWTHAHDDFAEGLAETGFLGGALIVWGLVLFFRRAFRNFRERIRSDWGWILVGAAVGTAGLLCHSFVDFNLRLPANAAWFVVCVALATHPNPLPGRPSRGLRSAPRIPVGMTNSEN